MTITIELEELQQRLEEVGQQHLLAFWDELTETEREMLMKDIMDIDFFSFFRDLEKSASTIKEDVDKELEPPSPNQCGSWNDSSPDDLKRYYEIGLNHISNGEYCAILLAGGAGTRLGVNYPKGMYNIGLPSGKSLFQIQAERLLRLQQLALKRFGRVVPIMWYIMTSDCTRDVTIDYFQKNNYFGLKHDQVNFFEQFTLPVVGLDGKILLAKKFKISKSPDGNGGLYRALNNYKLVQDMKNRGIKYSVVYGVDNILGKITDPVFLGFCVEQRAECAAKVVEKTNPKEPVGIICKVKGKFQVVEYSEISFETATMREENEDKLRYRCGNICTHLFSVDFLERVCQQNVSDKMPQHIAIKKVPFVNTETGTYEIPKKENAIKMEKFVFDIFNEARSFAIWEVKRNFEFSALKNAPGSSSDCPETARCDLLDYHRQLILDNLKESSLRDKVKRMVIEISPLASYSGEDLETISSLINSSDIGTALHVKNSLLEN